MIRSISHKGLRRLYEDGNARGVIPEHAAKLRDVLARLDAAVHLRIWICLASGCIRLRATSKVFGL
jgi:hypothetical protein